MSAHSPALCLATISSCLASPSEKLMLPSHLISIPLMMDQPGVGTKEWSKSVEDASLQANGRLYKTETRSSAFTSGS